MYGKEYLYKFYIFYKRYIFYILYETLNSFAFFLQCHSNISLLLIDLYPLDTFA